MLNKAKYLKIRHIKLGKKINFYNKVLCLRRRKQTTNIEKILMF
jgi:hypothetical protein